MVATLLCVNSNSRNGAEGTDEIVSKLEELGPVLRCACDARGGIESALEKHRATLQRIVIGGGDGTINCMLPTLVEAGLPCGIIPLGTANDLARSLGLPLEPVEAVAPIIDGGTRPVGLALVNGNFFVNAVGIGLGPELTKKLDRESKRRFGVLAYLSSLLDALQKMPRRRARLVVDGQPHRVAFMQITVANGIHYGGGMTVDEDASLEDGWLRVLCIEPQSAASLIGNAMRLRWGKHGAAADDEKVVLFKAREVTIETPRVVDVTADGEFVGQSPVTCRTSSEVLRFYAPRE